MGKKKNILLYVIVFFLCNFVSVMQAGASVDVGNIKKLDYTGSMQTVEILRSGTYNISLYGAQGADFNSKAGGTGGFVEVSLSLERGDNLYINVGGQNGYNGGGTGYNAGNGGGATQLFLNSTSNLVAVAGGGGGASANTAGGAGGTGGGYNANQGANGSGSYVTSAGGGGGYVGGTASSYLTHKHSGAAGGGGCYTIPVYHIHTGSVASGGGCYITHAHDSSCYSKTRIVSEVAQVRNGDSGDGGGGECHNGAGPYQIYVQYRHKEYDEGTGDLLREWLDDGWGESKWVCYFCRERKIAEGVGTTYDTALTCTKSYSLGCGKTGSSVEYYDLGCGKTESTVEVNVKSNGGTNYYNPSNSILLNSLSGQKSGNGAASVTLSKAAFSIDTQPVDAATFDGASAGFTCYSGEASQTGNYVWQTFIDGSYKTIGTVSYKEKNSRRELIFYNTKYEYGMDKNGVSYLNVKDTAKSRNNETKYRCIVYEFENLNFNLISNEAMLTILTSDISSMKASYVSDRIEVNNEIKLEDIFAICGYQSGKSEVVRNFEGLKITSFETEDNYSYQFSGGGVTSFNAYKTGRMKVNLLYENDIVNTDGEKEHKKYKMSFYVNVVDSTPPMIKEIDTTKDSFGNYYVPGSDFELQVRATVKTEDNYCETEVYDIGTKNKINTGEILYEFYRQNENEEWQKLTDSFRKGNYFDVLSSYGNGTYKVIAKDERGNISEPKQFTITAWDNIPPEVSLEIKEESAYVPYAELAIIASDGMPERHNIGKLHDKAYFLEKAEENSIPKKTVQDIQAWTKQNKYNIKANGLYRAYVRDRYDNMSYKEINIQVIDTLPPVVSYTVTSCGDGEKALITIKATDNNVENPNSAVSGLKKTNGTYDCFKYSDNVALNPLKEEGEYVRTYFYASLAEKKDYVFNTYDNAGNCTSNAITEEEIKDIIRNGSDNEYSVVERFTCENTDYTTKFPEWTANGVIITAEVKSGTNLPAGAYSWDYQDYYGSNEGYWDKEHGTWSSNPSFTVYENGTYTVYVKLSDGYINRKSIKIENIDSNKPTISATQNDETLTVSVEDAESGIDRLFVDGGSLSNMYEFTYDGKNSIKEMIELSQNGVYQIYAIDKAKNKSEIYSKTVSSIEEKNKYMVNFLTHTGAIVSSQYVLEGADATPPANLKKKGHTFVGWDKPFINIQEDTDINAVFVKDENKHTVTFVNWDGAVLKAEAVTEGESATPPSAPQKEGEKFTGWDSSYANVQSDVTVKALFAEEDITNKHKVNFFSHSEGIIDSQYVEEGAAAIPPKDVKREGYVFVGWDKSFANIRSDIDIKAVFVKKESKEEKMYTVVFCNWDGAVLKAEAVAEGKSATPPGNPTKEGAVFSGWDTAYGNVHGDVSTKAIFTETNTTKQKEANSGTGSGTSDKKPEAKQEEAVEEIEETVEERYIELTEFADEASCLSISAFDSEEQGDEDFINGILSEQTQEAETTESNEVMVSKIGIEQIIAILVLTASIGGTVFYFLNKKYYWINLPF